MRVFQDPATGTYFREDGKPGFACARCGNGYATSETRDDPDAHGCEGFSRDRDTFTYAKGLFDAGHTPEDIDEFADGFATVEFVCAWEYTDADGFGGHTEILGRDINPDGTAGPWKPLDDSFWLYLNDSTNPVSLDEVDTFLDETPYPFQNFATRRGYNTAYVTRTV